MKFVRGMVENIVEKGEYAGYQHFLLFPQCFQKASFPGPLKEGTIGKELKNIMEKPLSKHCGKRKNWNRISSFSHNAFNPSQNRFEFLKTFLLTTNVSV